MGFVPLLMSWKEMKKFSSKQKHQKKREKAPHQEMSLITMRMGHSISGQSVEQHNAKQKV